MIDIHEITRKLNSNAGAIRLLVESLSEEQGDWKPDPQTWSLKDVLEHLYNEERLDFRKHLKELFANPPLPWEPYDPKAHLQVESCQQALEGFLAEREASLAWIQTWQSPDWDIASEVTFGAEHETFILRAGDVLTSWLAHDYLHLRQINELLYAWNAKQATPYSVQYAGGW